MAMGNQGVLRPARTSFPNKAGAPSAYSESPLQAGLIRTARLLLIGTTLGAAWAVGATDPTSLRWIAVGLLASTAILMVAATLFRYPIRRMPIGPSLPIAIFIGYSLFQLHGTSATIPVFFQQVDATRAEFFDLAKNQLTTAAASSPIGTLDEPLSSNPATLIVSETQSALLPFLLAAVIYWLSLNLMTTAQSRRVLLWSVLVQAVALGVWGMIQRAGGSVDLLPGYPNPYPSIPFSSFIYRNAGAAAILPGFAAAVALAYDYRIAAIQDRNRRSNSIYEHAVSPKLSTRELAIATLALLVVASIVISLSRGAWMALIVAMVVTVLWLRKFFSLKALAALTILTVMVATVTVNQFRKPIEQRIERVDLEHITADQRLDHWKDGWTTALAFLPSGSGLGTYGYAVLPFQSEPRKGWFREAHNQYLEVLTESGVVGVIALLGLIVSWLVIALRLRPQTIKHSGQREQQAWGALAVGLFCFAAVQSAVDFVLVIPANLFLYAILMGALVRVDDDARIANSIREALRPSRTQKKTHQTAEVNSLRPAPYHMAIALTLAGATFIALAYTIGKTSSQQIANDASQRSSIADLAEEPSQDEILERLDVLDRAIDRQPIRASLYRHRAAWRMAVYRKALMQTAEASGESLPWSATRPESMAQVLSILTEPARSATIGLMTESELSTLIQPALEDYAHAIHANPLYVQCHFDLTYLSHLVGLDAKQWHHRTSRISRCDPQKLFNCGVLAFAFNLPEQGKKLWSECLQISPNYAESIFTLALPNIPPEIIAEEIVPKTRPELQVVLLRIIMRASDRENPIAMEDRTRYVRTVAEELINDASLEASVRHSVAGTIYQLISEYELAGQYWVLAVEDDPKNANFRLNAAESLRSAGDLEKALRHAVLGKTLATSDKRFDILIERIRREIATSKPRT